MPDWLDIVFRLGAAALTGSLIGIYLELQRKPTGMRTLGLVALASAVAVLAVVKDHHDADASRVIQGVITGVGFLGAGVILHRATGRQVVHPVSSSMNRKSAVPQPELAVPNVPTCKGNAVKGRRGLFLPISIRRKLLD